MKLRLWWKIIMLRCTVCNWFFGTFLTCNSYSFLIAVFVWKWSNVIHQGVAKRGQKVVKLSILNLCQVATVRHIDMCQRSLFNTACNCKFTIPGVEKVYFCLQLVGFSQKFRLELSKFGIQNQQWNPESWNRKQNLLMYSNE